eukprot:1500996-Amphidinium_carterae.1
MRSTTQRWECRTQRSCASSRFGTSRREKLVQLAIPGTWIRRDVSRKRPRAKKSGRTVDDDVSQTCLFQVMTFLCWRFMFAKAFPTAVLERFA